MRRYLQPIYERWIDLRARQAVIWLATLALVFIALSLAIHLPVTGALDLDITRGIQRWNAPVVSRLAEFFTFLGNTWTLVVLGCAAALFFVVRNCRLEALLSVVTLLGVPMNYGIKEVIGRPRPDGSLVSVMLPTVGLSFPSGHAMASTMLYGFLALMCWTHILEKRIRLLGTVSFATIPVLISFSRIYVGAHWFSDVIGGWTAGLLCLLVLSEVYKHFEHKKVQSTS